MVQAIEGDGSTEVVQEGDLSKALELLGEMNTNVQNVTKLVDGMITRVYSGELSTTQGLSFLEMKYQSLLSYLIDLTHIILRKCCGETIEGNPAIDRLIELRLLLEKIKPIDHKLKYQVNKLVRTTTGKESQTLKANVDDLIEDGASSENESDDDTGTQTDAKPGIYVPPKMTAVHYSDGKDNRNNTKRQHLKSAIIDDLREEYLDTPLEVTANESRVQRKMTQLEKDKIEYEETYFTRLPVSKADKARNNRVSTLGGLEDLSEFRDRSSSSKRKRKATGKGHGKKKGGKSKKRRIN